MPSRKIVLLGAGALTLLVVLVVLVARGGGGPSFKVERGDRSEFPLRGSLADDHDAVDGALQAWKDGRGSAADSRAARVSGLDVHLLYAETIGERSVVVVEQGDRLIAMVNPLDRGWYVDGAEEGFDPFDQFLVGTRRFTRAAPVAVVPVDWDPQTTDAVVVGRTRGGAVIAPRVAPTR